MNAKKPYPYFDTANPLLTESNQLDIFKGKSFLEFNNVIGLPIKNDKEHPIYDYELDVIDKIENNRNIWIKKARGIGITELILRYLAWKIVSTNELEYKKIMIVSGTMLKHANNVKERLQSLFEKRFPLIRLDSKFTELWIKNTNIICMPSRNVKDLRGYTDVSYLFIDEADYFELSVNNELLHSITAYEEKSNCTTIMVSTPNLPGGLFETIENDPKSKYTKIFLHYSVGLDKIFNRAEIEKKKNEPEFPREYEGKYGYGLGNVFLPTEIDDCCSIYDNPKINNDCSISMGIDPGFGSSKFGITVLMLQDNILKVMYAKEWDRPSYESMINEVARLRYLYKPIKIYIDGAKPDFCKSLKIQFGETTNYERIMEEANRDKADFEHRMYVCPISFNEHGREMLGRFQHVVSKKWFSLSNIEHKELVSQMRTAKYQDNGNLQKSETGNITYDVFDSTRLALMMYPVGEKRNGSNL